MNTTFRQIIEYDEYLGHKYIPNIKACLQYGNRNYLIQTDDFGFRNSVKKTNSKCKIICIGDSYTAGDGVSNKDRFTDIIEEKYDCEIINLAVSGYGIDQQILAYEKYSKIIKHDFVLFCPHLDDLNRNCLSEREGIDKSTRKKILIPKPYFVLKNKKLVLKNNPVPKKRKKLNTQEQSKNHTYLGKVKIKLKFHFYKYYNRILKISSFPEFNNEFSSQWIITKPLINKLKKLVKEKKMIIIPIPFNEIIDRNENVNYFKIFKTFEDSNTYVHDISSILKSHHNIKKESIYFKLCGHFSISGNAVVAKEIGELLFQKFNVLKRENKSNLLKSNDTYVLGISCFYHDSAATIIKNGVVIAAAQEERFTRIKHDKSFPINSINYCLEESNIEIDNVNSIVTYDNETWTIERILWNNLNLNQQSNKFWNLAKKSLAKKLKLPEIIRHYTGYSGEIYKCNHHMSHAAGAYYPSEFNNAAILVIDGVGEWACTTIAKGNGSKIEILKQQFYPHSLGLLYSAFTYYTGFKVNSGEYKLMGLAPYGKPIYYQLIKDNLVNIKEDGSISLNLDYFSFQEGKKMTNDNFDSLFKGPARKSESKISRKEMDIAASIQKITEEIVVKMANHAYKITNCKNLVMSGGVALNCVSNGHLFDKTPFKDFYFQPASGDAGGSLGAALAWYYQKFPSINTNTSTLKTAFLGPKFSKNEIKSFLISKNFNYKEFNNDRPKTIANFIYENKIIGHFDGRMEFGPRALGARSILGNPLSSKMQSKLNLKIKYRESFRPFAPIYKEDKTSEYFDFNRPSPYMLIVRKVNQKLLFKNKNNNENETDLLKIINEVRSEIPAITHVDNSARLQSVNITQNKNIYEILDEFEKLTGKGILINTSFNVRGEPIVCTPEDAYLCFMRTEMDVLVLGDFYLLKEEQNKLSDDYDWKQTYKLD